MKKNGWTKSDMQRLRECSEKGYSVYRTASALKRTVNSVRTKAARHKLPLPGGKAIRAKLHETQIDR